MTRTAAAAMGRFNCSMESSFVSAMNVNDTDPVKDITTLVPDHVTSILLIAIVIVSSAVHSIKSSGFGSSRTSSIPGPWRFPVVGSVHILGRLWFQSITGLRRIYGDVCRVAIGCQDVVVLSGWRTVAAALTGCPRTFAGRPRLTSFALASLGRSMTFNGISAEWSLHRRLAERALKRANDGMRFDDTVVGPEARLLVEELCGRSEQEAGEGRMSAVDPGKAIAQSIAHTMFTFCFGGSRKATGCGNNNCKNEPTFERMVAYTTRLIDCHNTGNAVNFFPWARRLLARQLRALEQLCSSMLAVTMRLHAEHVAGYVPGKIRDAVDALIECGQTGAGRRLEADRVAMTVQEFIGAGLDILEAAFHWTVLYVAEHEAVQDRVRAEIDAVVGRSRAPSADDVSRMPYTESVLLEVLRHSCVVPLALPHSTTADATINGVRLPADTFILVNLYSVNRDVERWGPGADRFDPDRFADASQRAVRSPTFTAFGLGRRRCIGEQLSRNVLFVYLATLLQQCRVERSGSLDTSPRCGIVLRPRPFQVVFRRR